MYYPIFLDISQAKCLIIGAGSVGLRKAKGLLEAGVKEILILENNEFGEAWQDLLNNPHIKFEIGNFNENHLQNCKLVFACTNNDELNKNIANLCANKNILCNCITAPLEGDFIVPALAKPKGKAHSSLMAALSTEGASPAWARVLRKELEQWLSPHAPMTSLLGRLRPLVLALGDNSEHNKELFRALVNSPLREYLAKGDKVQCEKLLHELLPNTLHKNIAELLYDII